MLYLDDAYLREFTAEVVAVDSRAVALSRTAFFPGGGGQPHDTGTLGDATVTRVFKRDGAIWHELDGELEPGATVTGTLDWERRHTLMRMHTALHVVNGVMWLDHGVQVTGANMTPEEGRVDFELPAISQEFGRAVEQRVNGELARDLPIRVAYVPRAQADIDPSLIRSKANLIPREIDPLRTIEIVGLDRQADSGTHVASTGEVGQIKVVKTESKGRQNKRIRITLV